MAEKVNQLEDLSNENIRVGQKVMLTIIAEGKYAGTINLISNDRNRIQLQDITFGPNNIKMAGKRQFYRPEIRLIEIISQSPQDEDLSVQREQLDPSTNGIHLNYEKFLIQATAFDNIQTMVEDLIYIKCLDQAFDDAVDDILKQDFVGLNIEIDGVGEVTLISISTTHRIYVMDITVMGGIDESIMGMLSSHEPIKVIHDVNTLSVSGLKFKGVFDTMSAHMKLGYSKKRTTLQECILEHMTLPSELDIDSDKEPIDMPIKTCAKSSAILLKFHDFLLEKLLKNAYASFDESLNYSRNDNVIDAGRKYQSVDAEIERLNRIAPFKLNIGSGFDSEN